MERQARRGAAPVTVAASVAERLREEIRDGRLKPGTRLRQAHVAAEYGVSTTPVREAFVALAREGLVESSTHRGVVVFQPSAAELREIYEIRIPLEALATEIAAKRLTDADLEALAKLVSAMPKASKRRDWTRARDLNEQFHGRIYAAAGRPRLSSLIEDLRASSRAYTAMMATYTSLIDATDEEHRAVFEALQARNGKKAARAMTAHLSHTVEAVSNELESKSRGS